MTTRFKRPIVCECGHEGFEHLTESGFMDTHEHYRLEGFEGGEVTIDGGLPRFPNILSALHPQCPACGRIGAVRYDSEAA
jgi:hypothetical protein